MVEKKSDVQEYVVLSVSMGNRIYAGDCPQDCDCATECSSARDDGGGCTCDQHSDD